MIFSLTGTLGGGQVVTITGEGFDDTVVVNICGQLCNNIDTNSTHVTCLTPASSKYFYI